MPSAAPTDEEDEVGVTDGAHDGHLVPEGRRKLALAHARVQPLHGDIRPVQRPPEHLEERMGAVRVVDIRVSMFRTRERE